MGLIAGLATVGFVLFVLIIFVYCCCRVRGKRTQGTVINELPDASPYRQTCHPSSPSTNTQQLSRQDNNNPYFMGPGGNTQGQPFLSNPAIGPGHSYLNPHQSTALYPTTGGGVPHNATVPYPVNQLQSMPMPMPMPMPAPQNYMPNNANFQPTAPMQNPSSNDPPPPYHAVVGQNPYQPYKFS